jgi:segregation and condensation protein B
MELKAILEAALFVAAKPLSATELQALFDEPERPEPRELRGLLAELAEDYRDRPLELIEVASGYRFQVRAAYSPWVSRLFEEKPGRYSKAFLETLAIIAYRQPVTRGEIEDIRGVAVSSNIVRSLQERDWVQVVGHKEVPGRPALFATTRQFLDYFNLRSLEQLPPLQTFIEQLTAPVEGDLFTPDASAIHHDQSAPAETEESDSASTPE